MKTVFAALFAVLIVASLVLAFLLHKSVKTQAATSGVGGQISIGAPSPSGGNLRVPINTTAPTNPYSGANVTLTWDPALLSFSSVDTSGTTLAAAGTLLCLPAPYSGAGGTGELDSCSVIGSPSITSAGLLMTFVLTVKANGCSSLHLVTLGPPDNGGGTFGTYTIDAATGNAQANTYGTDVSVPVGSGACAAATPTASPTPSNTPTPSSTPTATATPTSTFTPVSGAPDVAVGLFASPTAVDSGGNVTYSAFVANQGSVAAQNVALKVTLPPGGVLLSTGPCPVYTGGSFFCPIGTLAANNFVPGGPDEAMVTLPARMPYSTANTSLVAQVMASASNEPLANQGNNTATVAVAVTGCPDLNGDNAVNGLDLNIFVRSAYTVSGQPGFNPVADFNGDGAVDGLDLNIMARRFNQLCVGLDSDHDGLSDFDEINVYHTCPGLGTQFQGLPQCHVGGSAGNPLIADSTDTDGDGLPDGVEVFTYHSDPLNPDTDGDFYTDGQEAALGKNPTVYCGIMAADLDMDGAVTALDLNRLARAFQTVQGQPGFNPRADVNHDGAVNGLDLNVLAKAFGHFISECP